MSSGGRIWMTSEDKSLVWMTMTPDRLPAALEVMRKGFIPHEPVCLGLMLDQNEPGKKQFLQFCEVIAKDGVSIVAVDVSTDRVVGVAFNKIMTKPKEGEPSFIELNDELFRVPATLAIKDYLNNVDSRADPFEIYGVTSLLELLFLSVLPEYCGKKIGINLAKCTENMAECLRRDEVIVEDKNSKNIGLVMAIFSSSFSQRIGKTLEWDEFARFGHDEFSFEGKTFSERIGPQHPDNALMAKRIIGDD